MELSIERMADDFEEVELNNIGVSLRICLGA